MSERSAWPIVVGGCHRSGTSLLRRMLDAHPRIHCGPEVPFLRDLHGDFRADPLRHLRFTQAARSLLPPDELLAVLGAAFLELHERAAARAGKARWADKAPENVLYLGDWQRLLGDRWLFVHVVREPCDVVASMTEAGFPLTLPQDLEGRAAAYRAHVEAGLAFAARHPDRSVTVAYERLVADPRGELGRLMAGLGEAPDDRQLRFNDVPHQRGLEDPKVAGTDRAHAASVGRWRNTLSEGDAAWVAAALADVWERARAAAEGALR
jgi:hypothetical protein